ncbi:MAG: hydroxyacid dehydrogenase [Thermoplasmata archaeon]|jgi:D-3-phosphoglycerate dehydrogenase / 2-oxoglutarate reductase
MPAERVVVVADPIDREALNRLKGGPCRVVDASADPASLPDHLADAWALIVRSRTKVTSELLTKAPHLEVVARAGVGVDNVDLAATAARGIRVVNAPAAATVSVAELTVALYLLLVRGLYPSITATKSGTWARGTHGHELAGRTVGFVGYGRIAREVARRVTPFGVRAVAFDPFVPKALDATEVVSFDELLGRADIVSVHAALTPDNRHLLDARAFGRMKPGAFLVNVARGALVDEAALLAALASGHLGGAALDVFEVEPPMNRELLAHPNVIPTPHLGASTHEAQQRAGTDTVDEVLRALRGEPLTALVTMPTGGPR